MTTRPGLPPSYGQSYKCSMITNVLVFVARKFPIVLLYVEFQFMFVEHLGTRLATRD